MSKIPSEERMIDETSISKSENPASNARRNSLEKHLKHRPNVQELKDRHILLNTNVAPSIQGQQKELENRLLADTLKDKIINRPHPEDLIKRGILNEADKIYEERIEEEYAKREGGA
ncbi:putative rpel repeat protein [Golovinomyces cichoracearum]|uniref:Putative rpel repeat protein n=1 Tax=Golovinomyces cichoracearum TaxID=62708 RepID=A0A420IUU0_9PEZI|nr:putative rpel repeat protein [Golovinomyces cichoracearum]RKF83378.1 putative rpel repeat protein [Golovinomyces cichoracearum]